jgi:hypothetical protein
MAALPQREIARADIVDVGSRDARSRLAAMVIQLLDHWKLTTAEQSALLGLSTTSRSTLARYREGEPLADSADFPGTIDHTWRSCTETIPGSLASVAPTAP